MKFKVISRYTEYETSLVYIRQNQEQGAWRRGQQERNHTEVLIFQKNKKIKNSTSEKCSEAHRPRWRQRGKACGKRESKGRFKSKDGEDEKKGYFWMLQAPAKALGWGASTVQFSPLTGA